MSQMIELVKAMTVFHAFKKLGGEKEKTLSKHIRENEEDLKEHR